MSRYSEYKDSGVEWIGEIPRHWSRVKLKHHSDVTLGKMLTSQKKGEMVLAKYLRNKNVQDGYFDLTDVKEMWFSFSEQDRLKLMQGDLLVTEGGQVGRSALWKGDVEPCFFQNSLNRVRAKIGSTKFVYFLFQLYFHRGYFDSTVERVSIPHLTREKLVEINLVLPPDSEQLQIAQYLDKKTAQIDSLVEKLERKIELLKEYRVALISHCVTKGLDPDVEMKDSGIEWIGEIPRHWNRVKLKHHSEVTLGKMLTSRNKGDMMLGKYLRNQNVQDGFFDLTDVKEMWFSFSEQNRLKLIHGDLLVTEGGQVGRSALWKGDVEPCYFQNSLNRVRAKIGSTKFVFFLFQLYFHRGYFDSAVDRVSIPHLTRERLVEIILVLPPESEQFQMVQHLERKTAQIDFQIKKHERKIELFKEYRHSLISQVVTGKVRVTEQMT